MTREEWLLLFIAFEGAPDGLDPVRLQKGMFLFAQEGKTVPEQQKYEFRPYSYGPMSRDIYTDIEDLVGKDLVEPVPVQGQTWCRYRPTNRGVERGHRLIKTAMEKHPVDATHLYSIKKSVAGVPFADLLEDVYKRYPDYATKSIFRRR